MTLQYVTAIKSTAPAICVLAERSGRQLSPQHLHELSRRATKTPKSDLAGPDLDFPTNQEGDPMDEGRNTPSRGGEQAAACVQHEDQEMVQLRALQIQAQVRRGLPRSAEDDAFLVSPPAVAAIEAYRASLAQRPAPPEPTRVRRWDRTERLEEAFRALVPRLGQLRSPAEEALLIGFMTPAQGRLVTLSPPDAIMLTDAKGRSLRLGMAVHRGARVLDFELTGGNDHILAIEVDGHTFHGSEEQVTADKQRDRELMAHDVETIRFTAKEVLADPNGCAAQAFRIGLMKCSPFVVETKVKRARARR